MSSVVWRKKKENKTGTSKVGAISKAQKAQSFLNMPRCIHEKLWKHFRDTQSVPFMLDMTGKSLFPTGNKKNFEHFFKKTFLIFLKKTSKTSHSAEKWKGGPFGIH